MTVRKDESRTGPDQTVQASRSSQTYHAGNIRRALFHFLGGKAVSAMAGFTSAILIARNMAGPDYAAYVVILGIILLMSGIFSLGLREVVQRFIPELWATGHGQAAVGLASKILFVQAVSVCLGAVLLFALAPNLAGFLGMAGRIPDLRAACMPFAFLALFNFTSILLEALLLQSVVKWFWMLASLIRLGLILILLYSGPDAGNAPGVIDLLHVDAWANGAGMILALIAAAAMARKAADSAPDESQPPIMGRRIFSFAACNYLLILGFILQGGAVNKIVAAKFLPILAVAAFGFAQTLADQINNYLPNVLLLNLIRPALMGRFAADRSLGNLARSANMFFKVNLTVLLPLMLWLAVAGRGLASVLSNGRYPEAGPLFLGLVTILLMHCHYRRLELLAQAAEANRMLFSANLFMVASVIPAALMAGPFGAWGIVGAGICGCLCRDVFLWVVLRRGGIARAGDWPGRLKLAACAVVPLPLMLWLLPTPGTLIEVLAAGLASLILFGIGCILFKPFSARELELARKLVSRGKP